MAISRMLVDHGFRFDWFPYWMNGLPFECTYSPLLQIINAVLAIAMHWSTARAFHFTLGFFYCLGPVMLFVFAWQLSDDLRTSFLTALVYSLFSPSVIFPPVRFDVGGWNHPRRLHTLVAYGEGAHNVALAILPLALLLVWLAVTRRRFRWDVAAGLAIGALVLTNAFAAVDLAIAIGCLIAFYGGLKRVLIVGAITYLWISPFLTPSLIQIIRNNSLNAGFRLTHTAILCDLLILGGAIVIWRIFRRRSPFDGLLLSLAWIFAAIPALSFVAKISVVPQPERYHLEMELMICLAAVFAARSFMKPVAAVILIGFLVFQFLTYFKFGHTFIRGTDITSTPEYITAKWIGKNLPGKRILAGGDIGFWFNMFADNPQFGGGHDPFNPNWMQEHALYAIHTGDNGGDRDVENSLAWLKAFGCHAIIVPGQDSKEAYHPFRNPKKFEGRLPLLFQRSGNFIWAVPERSPTDARVVPEGAVVRHTPLNGIDLSEVNTFVSSIDDNTLPLAALDWIDDTHARITASFESGQVLAMAMTYDRGWVAHVKDHAVEVTRDGIGLLVVHPQCNGPCEVDLTFHGGIERLLCRIASFLVTGMVTAMVLVIGVLKRPVAQMFKPAH